MTEYAEIQEKMVRVVIIKPNLKYKVAGFNKGRSFSPKVGDKIDLPVSIAKVELRTGNIRRLLEEEKPKKKKLVKKSIKKSE